MATLRNSRANYLAALGHTTEILNDYHNKNKQNELKLEHDELKKVEKKLAMMKDTLTMSKEEGAEPTRDVDVLKKWLERIMGGIAL